MKKKIIIKAENIKKSYFLTKTNCISALNGLNIEVLEGDFIAVMGPSGCGKSTLLNVLGLLDSFDSGKLFIEGHDVSKIKEKEANKIRAKKIGFIFQGFNLIPTLTVIENVMLAGKYGGLKGKELKKKAIDYLTQIGLGNRLNYKPEELSGGQQQKVAIARSLINDPSIILADEPTGNLDSKSSEDILKILQKLNRENNQTFIIVTHDQNVAKACKSLIRMKDGVIEK